MLGLQYPIVRQYLRSSEFLQVLGPYCESAQPFPKGGRTDQAAIKVTTPGVGVVHKAPDSDSKQPWGSEFSTIFSRIY